MSCAVVVVVAISIIVTGIAVATVAIVQSEWQHKSDAHVRAIAREKQNNERLSFAMARIRDKITSVLDGEEWDE